MKYCRSCEWSGQTTVKGGNCCPKCYSRVFLSPRDSQDIAREQLRNKIHAEKMKKLAEDYLREKEKERNTKAITDMMTEARVYQEQATQERMWFPIGSEVHDEGPEFDSEGGCCEI